MPSDSTISQRWSEFIKDLEIENLPASVVEHAKARVLDCLGTAIAARELPVPTVALRFVEGGNGKATVFGYQQQLTAVDAGFVNGTLVNGTTHDDFLAKSHLGAVVVPAAIGVAEEEGGSGQRVIEGVVAGYEIGARAYLGGPGMLPYFRASGVAGAVASAAASGKLLALNTEELANGLGLSAMFASGFGEGFMTGTMDVKLNVGWACRSGISAAKLARCGATASPTEFEGKNGYFMAFSRSVERAAEATRGLGKQYLIEQVRYKERPVCFFVQTPVHLAHEFAQTHSIDPARVRRVLVRAPRATYTNPGYLNVAPYRSPLQARISANFTVAAALLGKPIHEHGFYSNLDDADVLSLEKKIVLEEDREDEEHVLLEVDYDGVVHRVSGAEAETLGPTTEKIIAKFRRVASDFLGARTDAVIELTMRLESVAEIGELTELLRPEKR